MQHDEGLNLLNSGLETANQTDALLSFWDRGLVCRYANDAYRSWFGKEPEEMIGKVKIADLRFYECQETGHFVEGVLKGEPQVFELELRTSCGAIKNCIATYKPYLIKEKVHGFFVHIADITPIRDAIVFNLHHSSCANRPLPDTLEKVVKTLQDNLLKPFPGLDELAKRHNVSTSKLKRDFHCRFEKGVFNYFRQMQMEFAYNYLIKNKCSRKEIAAILNFSNPSNFSACYNNYLSEKKSAKRVIYILKENDRRYKMFIAQSPFPIAMLDREACLLAASKKWFDFFKLDEHTSAGKSIFDILPGNEYWRDICESAFNGKIISKNEESIFIDGIEVFIRWDVRPWYISETSIGGALFFLEDITEAKHRETETLTLYEIMEKTNEIARIGAWKRDFVSNTGYWNKITKEIIEVPEDVEPSLDFALNIYCEGESRDKAHKVLNDALSYGKSIDFETEIKTAKGAIKKVRVIGYPVIRDGRCIKLLGIFQEITGR